MSHLKHSFLIIVAIFWGCYLSPSAYAATWATVIADKAVVFSDIQMTSKIGYISKGKKIRVGEKARNHGKLLPVVINKRVAYIQISDLQTSKRLEFLKSATLRLKEHSKKKSVESRISVNGSSLLSNVVFDQSATAEKQIGMVFLGIGLRGYRSDPTKPTGYRGGIEYYSGTNGDHQINYLAASADYFYKFMKTSYADIFVFAGGTVIPFAEYKLGSLFTLNGYGYGVQGGAEMLFKYADYALHLEGAYQYNQLTGFNIGGDNSDYPSSISPTTHGVRLMASISFAY